MVWNPLRSAVGEAFARSLATEVLAELGDASAHTSKKFQAKAGQVLGRAERRIQAFKRDHAQNWFQRSRTSNAFLWALKDAGCPEDYARRLTEWFVAKL
jgi:hypothetical protein